MARFVPLARRSRLLFLALFFGLAPALAGAQELAHQALSIFPADTQQVAYVDLAQLRSLPNYRALKQMLFGRQMALFEQFLRPVGIDIEKDVTAAIVGWRGDPTAGSPAFGVAAGSFDVVNAQEFIAQEHLPVTHYQGFTLDAFGQGQSPRDLYFTFLNGGLAAFGKRSDLKALIDGYQGRGKALSANAAFAQWASSLEGSAPEWGIATGKEALRAVAPWLAPEQMTQFENVIGPIKAVLYQARWAGDFSTEISVICANEQSARTLSELLSVWRDSDSLAGHRPAGINNFIQGMEINASGDTVTLDGQASSSAAAALLRGALAR